MKKFSQEVLKEQKRIYSNLSNKFSYLKNIQWMDGLMTFSLLLVSISLAIELIKNSKLYYGNIYLYLGLIFSIKLSMIIRQLQKNGKKRYI